MLWLAASTLSRQKTWDWQHALQSFRTAIANEATQLQQHVSNLCINPPLKEQLQHRTHQAWPAQPLQQLHTSTAVPAQPHRHIEPCQLFRHVILQFSSHRC